MSLKSAMDLRIGGRGSQADIATGPYKSCGIKTKPLFFLSYAIIAQLLKLVLTLVVEIGKLLDGVYRFSFFLSIFRHVDIALFPIYTISA